MFDLVSLCMSGVCVVESKADDYIVHVHQECQAVDLSKDYNLANHNSHLVTPKAFPASQVRITSEYSVSYGSFKDIKYLVVRPVSIASATSDISNHNIRQRIQSYSAQIPPELSRKLPLHSTLNK